jgi:hypothetical protein
MTRMTFACAVYSKFPLSLRAPPVAPTLFPLPFCQCQFHPPVCNLPPLREVSEAQHGVDDSDDGDVQDRSVGQPFYHLVCDTDRPLLVFFTFKDLITERTTPGAEGRIISPSFLFWIFPLSALFICSTKSSAYV